MKPSEILKISDDYTAYCFDEACYYISVKIKNGETPTFRKKYSSFTEMYNNILQ